MGSRTSDVLAEVYAAARVEAVVRFEAMSVGPAPPRGELGLSASFSLVILP